MFGPCNFFFFDSSVKKQAAVLFFSSFTLSLCRPALTCSTSHQSASASIADERHPEGTVEVGATELRRRQGGDVGGGPSDEERRMEADHGGFEIQDIFVGRRHTSRKY